MFLQDKTFRTQYICRFSDQTFKYNWQNEASGEMWPFSFLTINSTKFNQTPDSATQIQGTLFLKQKGVHARRK